MNKKVYLDIKSQYDALRKEAYERQQQRINEVFKVIPEIRDIEERIRLCGLKYNMLILTGKQETNEVVKELDCEIERLRNKKESLLKEHGFPPDYLEIRYKCPKCLDTGYIEATNERCSCFRQELLNRLYNESNLVATHVENFDNFDERLFSREVNEIKYGIKISPRENIGRIRKRCEAFIENFDSPTEKNLFFSGPAGVGKTFMANCISKELIERGYTVLYQTAPMLFNTITDYKLRAYKDDEFDDDAYKSIFEVELLIIDDLGTEPSSEARYAELLNILNTRQLNNLKRPCKRIISTNFGPKQLYEYYTERVASRIIGSFDRLMFAGDDIRAIKNRIQNARYE